jgi:hypothetical protein
MNPYLLIDDRNECYYIPQDSSLLREMPTSLNMPSQEISSINIGNTLFCNFLLYSKKMLSRIVITH